MVTVTIATSAHFVGILVLPLKLCHVKIVEFVDSVRIDELVATNVVVDQRN